MVDVFSPVTATISHILTQKALATQAIEISGKFTLMCMWDLTTVGTEDLVHIFYLVVPRTESREIQLCSLSNMSNTVLGPNSSLGSWMAAT